MPTSFHPLELTEHSFSVGCMIPYDRPRFPFNYMEISMIDICRGGPKAEAFFPSASASVAESFRPKIWQKVLKR